MSKLTKEELINALTSLLEVQTNHPVSIVQKGGWYKINDEKSVRFSELDTMYRELKKKNKSTVIKTPVVANKIVATEGLLPKELWRQKLTHDTHAQLPRGF